MDFVVLALSVTAVVCLGLGAACRSVWERRTAKSRRRLPKRWQLEARPLLTQVEHEAWHWLKRAFFDHHVLVKVPVIRFMSPRSAEEGLRAYELLNGVYCTFTVCAADGTVIGGVDIPGPQGLKASNRDLKQKLFAECGIAYAVVRATNLPTLEAMRAAFLGEIDLSDDEPMSEADIWGEPPLAHYAVADAGEGEGTQFEAQPTVPDTMRSANGAALKEPTEASHLSAIAAARSSLQAKLERNRKIRFTNFDPLSTSSGIVHDNADHDHDFVVQWEDSFIMGEEMVKPSGEKR
ncbi:MAG: DUF2726 domain-containing protein [Polaromonas sp.]